MSSRLKSVGRRRARCLKGSARKFGKDRNETAAEEVPSQLKTSALQLPSCSAIPSYEGGTVVHHPHIQGHTVHSRFWTVRNDFIQFVATLPLAVTGCKWLTCTVGQSSAPVRRAVEINHTHNFHPHHRPSNNYYCIAGRSTYDIHRHGASSRAAVMQPSSSDAAPSSRAELSCFNVTA